MSRRERIAAFEAWLQARGNAAELALFSRSVADGMLSLTGGGPLEPAHVAKAAALARDAGMSETTVAALGALLIEHEAAAEPPQVEPAPLELAAEPMPAPLAEIVAEVEPAPFGIKLRAAEPAARAAAEPDALAAPPATGAPERDAPVASAEPEPVAPPRRGWIGYAAGVAAAGGLVVAGLQLRGHRPAPQRTAATPADTRVRLRHVPLTADIPRGWREAADGELLPAGDHAPPMSLVLRDGSAADPDRGMFVAMLPASHELAGQPADAALIAAASTAERGLGAAVAHGAGNYVSAGCTVVAVGGARIGACVGTAQQTGTTSEVATFVRVIDDRELVAVTVTRPPSAAAAAENVALVASLKP